MKVVDLRSLASQLDIPGRSGATRKADLINLILDHQGLSDDIEEQISPAMSSTGDDGSDKLSDPQDMVRGASGCPGKRIQVGQGRFYPPRPITNLPRTYQSGWGSFPQARPQGLVTTTAKLPRPPP